MLPDYCGRNELSIEVAGKRRLQRPPYSFYTTTALSKSIPGHRRCSLGCALQPVLNQRHPSPDGRLLCISLLTRTRSCRAVFRRNSNPVVSASNWRQITFTPRPARNPTAPHRVSAHSTSANIGATPALDPPGYGPGDVAISRSFGQSTQRV